MPREKSPDPTEGHFGQRLALFRRGAGLSQIALAKVSGVSRRMIAHYENRTALPPGHVLSALADALNLSVDELVGKKTARAVSKTPANRRLLMRLQQLEKLPAKDKRELLGIIDTYLERNRLLQKAS